MGRVTLQDTRQSIWLCIGNRCIARVYKREVGGKSPNMEKEALKRAIEKLKLLVNLKEVVTDASSSIIKMMGTIQCIFPIL